MTAHRPVTRPLLGLALLAALLLAVLVPASPAHACSCAMVDPEARLQEAQAAFVGTLRGAETRGGMSELRFEVEAVMAGELPPEVTLIGPEGDGANCGLSPAVGSRMGLFLYPTDTGWGSSSCDTVDADELLAAGDPREPDPGLATGPERTAETTGAVPWIAVGATALAAFGILGLVVWFARRDGVSAA